MFLTNRILFRGIFLYLIYVFLFAIVLFWIQKPKEKTSNKHYNLDEEDNGPNNNDRVALIETGEAAIFVRLNIIENAKDSIDISYYTLTGGKSVDLVLASLLAAADRGVKIRILFDGIFHGLNKQFKDVKYSFASNPNIQYKLYEPLKIFKPRTWNNRLHDKLLIVDKSLALIGGRNIGDKYFDDKSQTEQYSKDRDVIVYSTSSNSEASSIKDMENYYNYTFNYTHSKFAVQKLTKRKKSKGLRLKNELSDSYIKFKEKHITEIEKTNWENETQKTNGIKFVFNPIARGNQDPWVLRKLLSLASQAKETILIQSPYVIFSNNMINKFKDYEFDTSKIKILTNSLASSPNPIAFAGYYNSKKIIVDSKAALYEYQGPQSLHGKTYIFDNKISAVGSFNFDARSSYINSEIMVIIYSEQFAKQLIGYVDIDLKNSLRVTKDYNYINNPEIKTGLFSKSKKYLIKFLARIVYFLDYLL